MTPYLIVLLALQLCQSTSTWAKVASTTHHELNSLHDKYMDFPLNPTNEQLTEIDSLSNDNGQAELQTAMGDVATSDNDDNIPIIQTIDDKTELQFRQPIEWVNVDQLRNVIVLKFLSPNTNYVNMLDPEELQRLRKIQENSIRFGKRAFDSTNYPERNHQVVRDSRGDNFMRFGRSVNAGEGGENSDFMRFGRSAGNNDFMRFGRAAAQDFMRFGRSPGQDFMRFGRSPGQDFMRFGRSPGQDFMRFGRSPAQDFMRFGRNQAQDFMRFGRNGQDFMRFGRSPGQDFMRFGRSPGQDFMRFGRAPGQDFMRFGRAQGQDFMRFGRSPGQDFMRFGRTPPTKDFMRFGRTPALDSDFMRFAKNPEKSENHTNSQAQMGKDELKQAVKLIHEADKSADSADNPVDKAIKVLFDNHQEHEQMRNDPDSTQHEDSDDLNMDMNYFLKNLK